MTTYRDRHLAGHYQPKDQPAEGVVWVGSGSGSGWSPTTDQHRCQHIDGRGQCTNPPLQGFGYCAKHLTTTGYMK